MADWKSKSKIEKVTIKPFFYFEFTYIPSNNEIKKKIRKIIDSIEDVSYEISVSYDKKHKGNFWDGETQQFYKWNELQELAETKKDYKLMENSINDNT
jgi:hypothetical protein